MSDNKNQFYALYQPRFVWIVICGMLIAILWAIILLFQVYKRPLPSFYARQSENKTMTLQPYMTPSLRPESILHFATMALISAYTFDFVNYKQQVAAVKRYFTDDGWLSYVNAIDAVIAKVKANQLFISSVIYDVPVIAKQNMLKGYSSWEVQLPLLVTYQSAQNQVYSKYIVVLTVVTVSTIINPLGLGISSLEMISK